VNNESTSVPTVHEWGFTPDDIARMEVHAGEAARLLKNLSHETRLLILCHLSEEELSVGELNRRVNVSQSVLSQHLAVLRKDGLVATRRQAQTIFYRLADDKAARMLALLHGLYCKPRTTKRRSR
jgi:DNA-binding transcriptional ArsR family regulator